MRGGGPKKKKGGRRRVERAGRAFRSARKRRCERASAQSFSGNLTTGQTEGVWHCIHACLGSSWQARGWGQGGRAPPCFFFCLPSAEEAASAFRLSPPCTPHFAHLHEFAAHVDGHDGAGDSGPGGEGGEDQKGGRDGKATHAAVLKKKMQRKGVLGAWVGWGGWGVVAEWVVRPSGFSSRWAGGREVRARGEREARGDAGTHTGE